MRHSSRPQPNGVEMLLVEDVRAALPAVKMDMVPGYSMNSKYHFSAASRLYKSERVINRECSLLSTRDSGPGSSSFTSSSSPSSSSSSSSSSTSPSSSAPACFASSSLTVPFGMISLSSFLNAPVAISLPSRPRLAVHWLAVEGQGPAIWPNLSANELQLRLPLRQLSEAVHTPTAPVGAAAAADRLLLHRGPSLGGAAPTAGQGDHPAGEADPQQQQQQPRTTKNPQQKRYGYNADNKAAKTPKLNREQHLPSSDRIQSTLVAPELKHVLTKEHRQLLRQVRESIRASIDHRCTHADLRKQLGKVLKVLRESDGLTQLLPSLASFFASEMEDQMLIGTPRSASILLRFAEALLSNEDLNIYAHVHQFGGVLLHVILARRPADAHAALGMDDLQRRAHAARVLGVLVSRVHGSLQGELQGVDRIILDVCVSRMTLPSTTLPCLYGATCAVKAVGIAAVRLVILPQLKHLFQLIDNAIQIANLEILHGIDESTRNKAILRSAVATELQRLLLGCLHESACAEFAKAEGYVDFDEAGELNVDPGVATSQVTPLAVCLTPGQLRSVRSSFAAVALSGSDSFLPTISASLHAATTPAWRSVIRGVSVGRAPPGTPHPTHCTYEVVEKATALLAAAASSAEACLSSNSANAKSENAQTSRECKKEQSPRVDGQVVLLNTARILQCLELVI
eukprot:GHVT01081540.1.p1 GENE.GHVT01081540.1~~GHVT01081540.1.p1  ORF type:complete len:685 (-),score=151.13 GHVT01081540.1:701-2755(-)